MLKKNGYFKRERTLTIFCPFMTKIVTVRSFEGEA
jgi:hypothetical protein